MILSKSLIQEVDLDWLINQKLREQKLNEILLIVPTNRKSRYLKKELIEISPQQSAGKINIETIGTFTTKLTEETINSSNILMSEAAGSVLLNQSFQETRLNFFSYYKKNIPFGTLNRVRSVISEYKRHGITPETIFNEAGSLGESENLKALDIAAVYSLYQKKCIKLGLNEIGDIYSKILHQSHNEYENKFKKLYPKVNLIIINGFDEFTSPEVEIINRLAETHDVQLFIYFDYYNFNPNIFSHLDKCYQKFILKGFKEIRDKSAAGFNEFQNLVRKNLFKKEVKKEINLFKSNITTIQADNRINEVELIAKEIKEIILLKHAEPNKICVVFNLIQNYSPLIRDIFTKFGIPFNLTDRFHLSTSAAVNSVINFLEILENDFYYKNIFRALSLNYLKIVNVDLSNILKASVELKIVSGYRNWIDILNDALNQLFYDEEETTHRKEKQNVYAKALEDIQKIFDWLKPFAAKLTIPEFKKAFHDLIFSSRIHSVLLNNADEETEKNIRAFEYFLSTVDEVLDLLTLEHSVNAKLPLKFFLNQIRTAVSAARYNIAEKPGYGVQVTTLNEIRGLSFDYLFISGLCDGDFPTRYTPEIFFSGSFVKSENIHQIEQRYHFYQALCSWKKQLYFTYPLHDEKRDLVQSNFLTDFLSIFTAAHKTAANYDDKIYSKEELLIHFGRSHLEEAVDSQVFSDLNIDLNSINQAILIDQQRLNKPFTESAYTGFISDQLTISGKDKLTKLAESEYSATQLEIYALCPYKYFAEKILNLQPPAEPTEEIEALEMGSLLHLILYEFYTRLKEKKILLNNASDEEFKIAEDLIFSIANEKIKQANFKSELSFFEIEKIVGIDGNRKQSILYKFLEQERFEDEGYTPEFFEAEFGNLKSQKEKMKIGNLQLRGKIDRIEINHSQKRYKVVDYKLSGKKLSKDDFNRGLSLQLPLYMYAAKKIIHAQLNKDYEPAGSEIYSLKFNSEDFGKKAVKLSGRGGSPEQEVELNKNLINLCLETINKYAANIQTGKFHLSTLEDRESKVCKYCNFKAICRIQEVI